MKVFASSGGEPTLVEIKQLLEARLQTITEDVKGIKADLKVFDDRLM